MILVNIFVHFISFHDAKISEYKIALGPKGQTVKSEVSMLPLGKLLGLSDSSSIVSF